MPYIGKRRLLLFLFMACMISSVFGLVSYGKVSKFTEADKVTVVEQPRNRHTGLLDGATEYAVTTNSSTIRSAVVGFGVSVISTALDNRRCFASFYDSVLKNIVLLCKNTQNSKLVVFAHVNRGSKTSLPIFMEYEQITVASAAHECGQIVVSEDFTIGILMTCLATPRLIFIAPDGTTGGLDDELREVQRTCSSFWVGEDSRSFTCHGSIPGKYSVFQQLRVTKMGLRTQTAVGKPGNVGANDRLCAVANGYVTFPDFQNYVNRVLYAHQIYSEGVDTLTECSVGRYGASYLIMVHTKTADGRQAFTMMDGVNRVVFNKVFPDGMYQFGASGQEYPLPDVYGTIQFSSILHRSATSYRYEMHDWAMSYNFELVPKAEKIDLYTIEVVSGSFSAEFQARMDTGLPSIANDMRSFFLQDTQIGFDSFEVKGIKGFIILGLPNAVAVKNIVPDKVPFFYVEPFWLGQWAHKSPYELAFSAGASVQIVPVDPAFQDQFTNPYRLIQILPGPYHDARPVHIDFKFGRLIAYAEWYDINENPSRSGDSGKYMLIVYSPDVDILELHHTLIPWNDGDVPYSFKHSQFDVDARGNLLQMKHEFVRNENRKATCLFHEPTTPPFPPGFDADAWETTPWHPDVDLTKTGSSSGECANIAKVDFPGGAPLVDSFRVWVHSDGGKKHEELTDSLLSAANIDISSIPVVREPTGTIANANQRFAVGDSVQPPGVHPGYRQDRFPCEIEAVTDPNNGNRKIKGIKAINPADEYAEPTDDWRDSFYLPGGQSIVRGDREELGAYFGITLQGGTARIALYRPRHEDSNVYAFTVGSDRSCIWADHPASPSKIDTTFDYVLVDCQLFGGKATCGTPWRSNGVFMRYDRPMNHDMKPSGERPWRHHWPFGQTRHRAAVGQDFLQLIDTAGQAEKRIFLPYPSDYRIQKVYSASRAVDVLEVTGKPIDSHDPAEERYCFLFYYADALASFYHCELNTSAFREKMLSIGALEEIQVPGGKNSRLWMLERVNTGGSSFDVYATQFTFPNVSEDKDLHLDLTAGNPLRRKVVSVSGAGMNTFSHSGNAAVIAEMMDNAYPQLGGIAFVNEQGWVIAVSHRDADPRIVQPERMAVNVTTATVPEPIPPDPVPPPVKPPQGPQWNTVQKWADALGMTDGWFSLLLFLLPVCLLLFGYSLFLKKRISKLTPYLPGTKKPDNTEGHDLLSKGTAAVDEMANERLKQELRTGKKMKSQAVGNEKAKAEEDGAKFVRSRNADVRGNAVDMRRRGRGGRGRGGPAAGLSAPRGRGRARGQ